MTTSCTKAFESVTWSIFWKCCIGWVSVSAGGMVFLFVPRLFVLDDHAKWDSRPPPSGMLAGYVRVIHYL